LEASLFDKFNPEDGDKSPETGSSEDCELSLCSSLDDPIALSLFSVPESI
jgi:hypothetical protein